ncbi:hypothetical protein [Nonomuraea dietziae]|uniref:hypothetical protein n=1 Tax=Nonomuraea dietziae TaxID=65515 RepID=UPI0033201D56
MTEAGQDVVMRSGMAEVAGRGARRYVTAAVAQDGMGATAMTEAGQNGVGPSVLTGVAGQGARRCVTAVVVQNGTRRYVMAGVAGRAVRR